jgi:hypothetical protein
MSAVYALMTLAFVANAAFFNPLVSSLIFVSEHGFLTGAATRLVAAVLSTSMLANLFASLLDPSVTLLSRLLVFAAGVVGSLVVLVPVVLLLNWGAYSPAYVKGQSVKRSVLVELATDLVHLLSFFLRINIQLIRVVIFGCVSYAYSELYLELIAPSALSDYSAIAGSGLVDSLSLASSYVLDTFARLLYEVGHL